VADSLIVHFSSVGWGKLELWIDAQANRIGARRWNYPDPSEPLLFIYEYADHLNEYESDELDRLCDLLGGFPSAAVCLQLRRRDGVSACDAAARLTAELLRAFAGVADDTFANEGSGYWLLADLDVGAVRSHGRFLDCYRTGRHVVDPAS
jgi:hypothetical protein